MTKKDSNAARKRKNHALDIKALYDENGSLHTPFSLGHHDKEEFARAVFQEFEHYFDDFTPIEEIVERIKSEAKHEYARWRKLGQDDYGDFEEGTMTLRFYKDPTPQRGRFPITYWEREG